MPDSREARAIASASKSGVVAQLEIVRAASSGITPARASTCASVDSTRSMASSVDSSEKTAASASVVVRPSRRCELMPSGSQIEEDRFAVALEMDVERPRI